MTSLSPSKSRSAISKPHGPLKLLSIVTVLKVGVSLTIAVGFELPNVAVPPEIDKVKSPVSKAPLPLSVS